MSIFNVVMTIGTVIGALVAFFAVTSGNIMVFLISLMVLLATFSLDPDFFLQGRKKEKVAKDQAK